MIPIGTQIRMRENGLTYREISERTGIPYTTISSRMHRLGIKPKVPVLAKRKRFLIKHGNIDPELVRELYWVQEKSVAVIAAELNIPSPSLRLLMDFYDIPRRTKAEGRRLFVSKADKNSFPKPTHEEAVARGIKSGVVRRRRAKRRIRERIKRQAESRS